MGQVSSRKRRVRDDDFMVGSWSEHARIMLQSSFYRRKQFTDFWVKSWTPNFVAGAILFGDVGGWLPLLRALCWTVRVSGRSIINVIFPGKCSIWWCWRVIPVARRIVLDVSCVTGINHERHFSWQGQYLVMLECESCFPRNALDVSWVATIKHECCSSIVLWILQVAPRKVLDVSCVAAIKRISTEQYSVVLSGTMLFFVVRNSTGVILCSTE